MIDFCDNKNNFRKNYQCIYHDINTQNNRKLNKHVDIAKNFINRRRELTKIKNFNCK